MFVCETVGKASAMLVSSGACRHATKSSSSMLPSRRYSVRVRAVAQRDRGARDDQQLEVTRLALEDSEAFMSSTFGPLPTR